MHNFKHVLTAMWFTTAGDSDPLLLNIALPSARRSSLATQEPQPIRSRGSTEPRRRLFPSKIRDVPGRNKAHKLPPGFYLFFTPEKYASRMRPQQECALMIRCPKTGQPISTGRYVEFAAFRSSPVFFSRTYCPLCHEMHEWFAKDAWVCDSECSEREGVCEQQVA